MDPLEPFTTGPDSPWDRQRAAHLARRAGFGAFGEELDRLVALGPNGAVAHFVDAPAEDTGLDREVAALGSALDPSALGPGAYGRANTDRLRRWWLYRMVRTRAPLREKIALFWHDHFAVQEGIVIRTQLLAAQNATFRECGLGPFGVLLARVARDPAMLVFLDNRLSTKESPNENWARELLELFTLGVDEYTQQDVRELARIFTGWTTRAADSTEFRFAPEHHDTGDKVVLGRTIAGRGGPEGEAEGDEALAHILTAPAHTRFLARKLVEWFGNHVAPPEVVDALADVLRAKGGSIRETLRVLFASRWFHGEAQDRSLYRNPVELVVSAARALEIQNPHLAELERHTAALGLELFEPPSVAGWEHGDTWVRTGSVAPRLNFALALAELPHASRPITGRATVDLERLAASSEYEGAALLDLLCERLLQQPLEPNQRTAVLESLEPTDASETGRAARDRGRERVRAVVHLLLASPQFTLA
ncbi:MAG: DUF1800 family protein [Planctomycetaceae bacterium]|nr:DUF1800 family protein [Planctomycetaceae bacterium]